MSTDSTQTNAEAGGTPVSDQTQGDQTATPVDTTAQGDQGAAGADPGPSTDATPRGQGAPTAPVAPPPPVGSQTAPTPGSSPSPTSPAPDAQSASPTTTVTAADVVTVFQAFQRDQPQGSIDDVIQILRAQASDQAPADPPGGTLDSIDPLGTAESQAPPAAQPDERPANRSDTAAGDAVAAGARLAYNRGDSGVNLAGGLRLRQGVEYTVDEEGDPANNAVDLARARTLVADRVMRVL